jgi:hypothetical protein
MSTADTVRDLERFTIDAGRDNPGRPAGQAEGHPLRAPDLDKDDQAHGLSTRYIKPPAQYRADGFDRRAAEAKPNRFTHHRIDVGSTPAPFIREPGTGLAPSVVWCTAGPGSSGTGARSSRREPIR